jgi:hypothetical protein
MKKRISISMLAASLLLGGSLYAGNPQRVGQAGASELLINPWARNTGWGGVNLAGVKGVEASFVNIAGIAGVERTDVAFSNTQWLVNSGISINSFGFAQKVGSNGVMGANIVALDYGEWEITDEFNPEGGIGTISPSTITIGVSYAQKFTESIQGGVNIKIYNSSFTNLSATAVCFDAGVQYHTGAEKQLKFGVTLKNIGPSASFSGDGQVVNLPSPTGLYTQAYQERSSDFEVPALLALGGSYDFNFTNQRFTVAGMFQSNSFEKDQYTLGGEYSMKEIVAVRAGYTFFDNSDNEKITTVFTGVSAGLGVNVPLGENKLMVDYSYRATKQFQGVHSIGLTFSLR